MTGFIVLEENMSSLEKKEMDIALINSHIYSHIVFLMPLTHVVIEY